MTAALKGKKVTVMGLGLHGGALGTIRWLHAQGAVITVTDMKTSTELQPSLDKLSDLTGVTFVLGEHRPEDFSGADLVIRNPGVKRTSPFLQIATEHNVPVEMDSSLFFQYCPSQNIIGITGSKGKSTTTNAITQVLSQHYPKLVTVGFDKLSPLGALPEITKDTTVVFELSSWRLEPLAELKVSPQTAIATSIYRDHLNTYDSYEDYIETKKLIFKNQKPTDVCLLNADDKIIKTWTNEVPSQLYWYSMTDELPGQGIYVKDGQIVVRANRPGAAGEDDSEMTLMPTANLPLQEEHAQRNLLPALLLGYLAGMTREQLQAAVRQVTGLPHRLETVRTLHDVTYINDSAATMPDATIAALASLSTSGQSIVHILGGSDKDLLFEDLVAAEHKAPIRALVFLPGTVTDRLHDTLVSSWDGKLPPIIRVQSMIEAVTEAQKSAQSGDIVLLSPGATSFGLFQHEFDRGDQFRQAVQQLV